MKDLARVTLALFDSLYFKIKSDKKNIYIYIREECTLSHIVTFNFLEAINQA